MLKSTKPIIRTYFRKGKSKGQKVNGKWYITDIKRRFLMKKFILTLIIILIFIMFSSIVVQVNPIHVKDYISDKFPLIFTLYLSSFEELDEAEKECIEAIRINPDFAKAHYNLGNLLKDKGREEDAEAEYREAIRINPDFADAHINLGNLLN